MSALPELSDVTDALVAHATERGAALYVREQHLAALIGDWRHMTDAEIVERLQRKLRQMQRLTLATGHWTGDINRIIALKQALARRAEMTAAETVVEFRSNRMTQAEYERERERIRETYGDNARDAGARREQELARLFYRSGWTQEVLAKKEGKSQQRVGQSLRFGRFLEFTTDVVNLDFAPANLSEGKFRSYWERTDKNESNERIRFRAVLDLINEETRLGQSTAPKFAVGRALVEKFADGKWHARETIGKAFPDTPPTDIDAVLYHMHAKGTYGCRLEKRKNGRSFDVRIFRKVREVPAGELKEKLGPLIKLVEVEGRKNAATVSIPTIAHLALQLRKLLEEWTE